MEHNRAVTVALVLQSKSQIGADICWPLRIAALVGSQVVVVVPASAGAITAGVDLTLPDEQPRDVRELATSLREALDAHLGEGRWSVGTDKEEDGAPQLGESSALTTLHIRLQTVPHQQLVKHTLALICKPQSDFIILVTSAPDSGDTDWEQPDMDLIRGFTGQGVLVVPGRRRSKGEIVVAASPGGRYSRTAIRLAEGLARQEGRSMTGLYVEHNIGPDARLVGERILDRLLGQALEGKEKEVQRLVEVDNRPQHGLLRVCEDERCEVLVTGASRIFEIGERGGGVPAQVARGTDQPTIVIVRGTVPRRARTLRWLDDNVQRLVPQLNHNDRLGVVERIQTNAQWTFDYILLLGLATLIAAMGLLANSVAVIIGAMLIAPLMTPLIGLGLAITQGNLKLAHITLKALGLSVLISFAIAAAVGFSDIDFHVSTAEMLVRHWPGELNLIIAFAGGLAAAYAYGRPGLLAALPGVAISAALLPPLATSGLALTIHDYDLAIGALLLFMVNMVAITLAAALSLWAVGFRYAEKSPQSTRILGMALTVTLVVMVLVLPLTEPRSVPPTALVEAVEEALDEKLRLRRIYLKHEPGGLVLQVDLGGSHMPSRELGEQLRGLAEKHLVESGGVRLTFRYETLIH